MYMYTFCISVQYYFSLEPHRVSKGAHETLYLSAIFFATSLWLRGNSHTASTTVSQQADSLTAKEFKHVSILIELST